MAKNPQDKNLPDEKRRIENEARARASLDPVRIIAGRDGGGHLKGASPTPVLQRALLEAGAWLEANLDDTGRALQTVILRRLSACPELLEQHLGDPQHLLARWVESLLASDSALAEFVREVDMAWGQANQERPFFQVDGAPPHPDDPYTLENVRRRLTRLQAGRA